MFCKVIGLDYNNDEKRLLLSYNDENDNEISRTIHDIKRIARAAKANRSSSSSSSDSLPIHVYKIPKELKKLLDNDIFRINSNGYDKSMIKAIKVSETYINFLLDHIDDPNKQVFINEEMYQQNVISITERRINEKKPRLLQQFFTKYNDINELISLAITDIDIDILANTIFIEPSCGDGRILLELCNRNYKCIGIDIDDQILEKAKNTLKSFESSDLLLELLCIDFLTLSKSQILPILDNKNVIVIGNPPYRDTLGIDQDYTMRFIMKCKEICSRIAFILPSRAGKDEFIDKLRQDFKIVEIKEDLEGKFEFMDTKEISQPSIMLVLDII